MKKLRFPTPFHHHHPPVRNVNELFEEQLTFGQRAADLVARIIGTWRFIIIQTLLLTGWVIVNITAWIYHWDPYPFILMNLVLSLQAAYTAPLIMMSQNRQAARDRLEAHNDYLRDPGTHGPPGGPGPGPDRNQPGGPAVTGSFSAGHGRLGRRGVGALSRIGGMNTTRAPWRTGACRSGGAAANPPPVPPHR